MFKNLSSLIGLDDLNTILGLRQRFIKHLLNLVIRFTAGSKRFIQLISNEHLFHIVKSSFD